MKIGTVVIALVAIGMDPGSARGTTIADPVVLLQEDFEQGLSSWQISAPSPNQATILNFSLSDGFESGLGGWALTGTATTTTSPVYEGSAALLLDYQGNYASASRSFASATNLRARVYFYDNGDQTLGTVFQLGGSGSPINCGSQTAPYWLQPNTALGVKTDVSGSYYIVRVNCGTVVGSNGMFVAEETKPGQAPVPVPRKNGWHLFELLVTPAGTYARIDDREIAHSNPGQIDATSVAFGSSWGLTGQAVYDGLSIQAGYQSGKSLFLSYTDPNGPNENAVYLSRSFEPAQNILARTFFYDTMDSSLGTLFMVMDSSGAWQTGLGVVTNVTNADYTIRINSASGMSDTTIPRSAGWHMFEIIVTDRGAYAKIDNRLVPQSNLGHTSAATVRYLSTWGASAGLLGQAIYDDLRVVEASTASWQDQLYMPLNVHYDKYSSLVPPGGVTVFSPLYPQLGGGASSNDLRSVMDSAIAWYLYGVKSGDTTAKALAKRVFLEGWSNAPWKRPGQDVDDWARGVCMRTVAHAAYILWNELDQTTRDQVVLDLYNQAQTYAVSNRQPASGFENDTKAEENAWHAAFLASVVNLFPNPTGFDKEWIEAKARCFAYHSITVSTDGMYCGLVTQTVHDDYQLDNHGQESPTYSAATLQMLGEAAFDYRQAGRPIPPEFSHNVQPLFNKYMTYVDPNTYHFNAPSDWDGAVSSAFLAPDVFRFAELLGVSTGVSWQDYLSKRSIFYYDMSSSWLKKTPAYTRIQEWNQSDKTADSYKFLLDSAIAGEHYAMALYSLSVPSICEEDLYKEKAWAGVLNWTCDRNTRFSGSTSVRLSTATDSNVEAYSPLKSVNPNWVYKVSYAVSTNSLAASAVDPAAILARVVPAQYTSAAQESDAINAGNRIDSGLSYGVNQNGTTAWGSRSYDFVTTSTTAFVRLRGILAGMGKGRGTAWFDDVNLIPLSKRTVPAGSVIASSFDPTTPPGNAVDGDLSTRWSGQGDGQWIRLDLGTNRDVSVVRIAFYVGDQRTARFDIQTSLDGASWTTVYSGSSNGLTTQLQTFDAVDSTARFIRVVGHGNSQNDWNSLTEIEVWGR
jgi:hypothetical protein